MLVIPPTRLALAADLSDEAVVAWAPAIAAVGTLAELNTAARWSMWLAQCGHESAGFTQLVESLNYTDDALVAMWPGRVSIDLAAKIGRTEYHKADQQAIACAVYGNRLGNRPNTLDPWHYRGRGLIQVTGRENYEHCGKFLGVDLLTAPEMLGQDRHLAAKSTAWYWRTREINKFADVRDVRGATKAINGGTNHLEDRNRRFIRAMSHLSGRGVIA